MDDRPRIRRLVAEARAGLGPWDATPTERLAAVAGQCGIDETTEIIDEIDALSREKQALPDWDGDTSDDISRAQETYAHILAMMPPDCRRNAARGLGSALADTRRWVVIALEMQGESSLPDLRDAIRTEDDEATRQMLAAAIERLGKGRAETGRHRCP